jgi:hypothetical protein
LSHAPAERVGMRHRLAPSLAVALGVLAVVGATTACGSTTPAAPTASPPAGPPASSSPSARRHSAIAYDAARQRVLLFGGVDNSNAELDDLWSWNGSTWTRLAATTGGREMGTDMYATPTDVFSVSPAGRVQRLSDTRWVPVSPSTTPARALAAYAYDSARGRLVRFGGGDAPGQAARETWEFDGQSWTLVSTQGPSARFFPSMAYDPLGGVTVLFGGLSLSEQKLDDTWEWDGRDWTQAGGTAPAPRFGATMVYDGGAGEMLLFGGIDEPGAQINELWRRSTRGWSLVTTSGGPSPRAVALMAFDGARRNVLLFGGDGGQSSLGDTWTWDGSIWSAD